jgi:hypothetical protein
VSAPLQPSLELPIITGMLVEWRQVASFLGAMLASGGAVIASVVAWVTRVNLCEGSCHVPPVLEAQLVVALAGLVPALVLLYATARWRTRLAVWALMSGIAIYAAWGLLNNVAVHGSLFGG